MAGYDWVSLTTDYGLQDGFVAACRGVLGRMAPAARVIDVTHQVPPGDVARGSAVLAQTVPYLPRAIHVAVVDPGVGTARRGVAIECVHGALVGPDNGLLVGAAEALGGMLRVVELTEPSWFAPQVSSTFHGRDIFAPVAARLALDADIAGAGAAVETATLVRLPEPVVIVGEGWLDTGVLTVDRFGNVQLAASADHLPVQLGADVRVAGVEATLVRTFGEVRPGALLLYVDSADHLAIAINGGSAAAALSVSPGDVIRISGR